MLGGTRYLSCALAVVLAGAALRVHGITQVPLWMDETDFFTEGLFRDPPQPLLEYAASGRSRTTNNVGWFASIWTSVRLFGRTPVAARLPSLICSIAFLAVLYVLVCRITGSPPAALIAMSAAAASIPLLEHSQRAFAYASTPLWASLIILAHIALLRRMGEGSRALVIGLGWYVAAASLALFMHLSLTPLIAASAALLALRGRRSQLRYAAPAAAIILSLALLNAKRPSGGFRSYLDDYYPESLASFVPFLVTRTYDLVTYQLEFFFHPGLYWPLSLNPVLLPLVAVCVLGWAQAVRGRWGGDGREAALLALLTTAAVALLALLRFFPYGGVRQNTFLAPAVMAFFGMGVAGLLRVRWTRIVATGLALVYAGIWATTLPRFYSDRVAGLQPGELASIWEREGRLPLYAAGGSEIVMRYEALDHPEIRIEPFTRKLPPAPFLVVSPHWPLNQDAWVTGREQQLKDAGYRTTALIERPARHLDAWRYPTCLYFPPAGLWVYRVEAGGQARVH